MTIICLDDHSLMLESLTEEIKATFPYANIQSFQRTDEALGFAQQHGCDILFCEIELCGDDGLLFAEKLQAINPRLNIIFVTVCEESARAKEVLHLRPSGYLTKPFTKEQIRTEIQNLRYPVHPLSSVSSKPHTEQKVTLPPVTTKINVSAENVKMDSKDLRKLGRAELLEMLIEQSKEVEQLKAQLQEMADQMNNKRIIAEESGSIAEVAMQMNGVFEAAQRAADQYLENVRMRTERQVETCARRDKECADRVEQMLSDTHMRCINMEDATTRKCEEMIQKAEAEAQKYWDEVSEKMERYLTEHEQLRSLMAMSH